MQQPSARRQAEIVTLAREIGRVSVEELALRFAVTPQTIRRDLNELCDAKRLTRVHGGAIIASSIENLAYEARKLVSHEQKRRIGEAAARLIPDQSAIFINLGTTTEEVARALAARSSSLLVVTNNLNVATALYRNRAVDVVITGGSIRSSDGGIVGHTAVEQIQRFQVDVAVIGTSAIGEDGTLLDYDIREVEVSRAIIENARRVLLVADSSKFRRHAPVRIGRLDEVDVMVTDYLPASQAAALTQQFGVEIVQVGAPEEVAPEERGMPEEDADAARGDAADPSRET
ncbi:MAG: DeoR/GlpR transcriptional regulator [Proteobacteria bacterium]|nr:DeoR/GlpR transcriptional regulator [Pseudomonadota bacterium]